MKTKQRKNHPVVRLSADRTILTSQATKAALQTLLYEKWSSFSHISFSATRRLESEGGALWRKHSCSGHLYHSCNLLLERDNSCVGEIISSSGGQETI